MPGDTQLFRKALLSFILLLLWVSGVSSRAISRSQSQQQSEEITAEEIREAQQTAKLFVERLGETRDLRPACRTEQEDMQCEQMAVARRPQLGEHLRLFIKRNLKYGFPRHRLVTSDIRLGRTD
jgi:hypothetical protein